jgi:hypothetical protein
MIYEPDVTLTDYGLAIMCAIFARMLLRREVEWPALRTWFAVFFTAVSAASLLGGTVHGFFPDVMSAGYRALWPATLFSIGIAAAGAWMIGLVLRFPRDTIAAVAPALVVGMFAYIAVVLFVSQDFVVAMLGYMPSSVFLLIVLTIVYFEVRQREVLLGIVGVLLTFVAAAVQQIEIGIHPSYFNHDALYHVIQAVALYMLFLSAIWLVAQKPDTERGGL